MAVHGAFLRQVANARTLDTAAIGRIETDIATVGSRQAENQPQQSGLATAVRACYGNEIADISR